MILETNVDTNAPTSGTHDPSDVGIPLAIGVQLGTGDNVDDEAIQEEGHMSMPKTTMISSTTEVGNEHSTIVFINKTLVIIKTKNTSLTFLYCHS